MTVASVSSYLRLHEHLIIAILVLALGVHIVGKVDNRIAQHDNAALQSAQVADAAVSAQVQKDATAAALLTAQYQALSDKVTAQNAALIQANAALTSALTRQQQTDNTMTDSELTDRWNILVPSAGVTNTSHGVTLTSVGAHATVSALEQVPVLTTELSNSKAETANVDSLLLASNSQVSALDTEIGDMQKKSTDDAKVCTDQIAVVKADARKSKKRWFEIGFVAGIATRVLFKF